jgi:hypothetical protein
MMPGEVKEHAGRRHGVVRRSGPDPPRETTQGRCDMAVELKELDDGKLLEVRLTGKLEKNDYAAFVPAVERLVKQHGKIRMLVTMHDFHGWTAGALWEDIKFDAKHFSDIARLALVGEKKWEKGMAVFCKPFTTAKLRYFDHTKEDEARLWLQET